jgi:hypothetical protein
LDGREGKRERVGEEENVDVVGQEGDGMARGRRLSVRAGMNLTGGAVRGAKPSKWHRDQNCSVQAPIQMVTLGKALFYDGISFNR